ncbi:hypothetical protein [Burkholderia ubonensis]|uniref:hypothetical protein n=1 Tax=Burkholderia ubonensis TaxID=101571 RepID=UPI0012FCF762|nr:hypothetical protein [Burkholderia ubonensis]
MASLISGLVALFVSNAAQSEELSWLADKTLCTASMPNKFYKPDGNSDLAKLQQLRKLVGAGKAIADGAEVIFGVKPGVTLWGFQVESVVLLKNAYPAGSSLAIDVKGNIEDVKAKLDRVLTGYERAGPFVSRFNDASQGNSIAYVRSVKYNPGYVDQGLDEKIGTFRVFLSASKSSSDLRTSVYCAVEQE